MNVGADELGTQAFGEAHLRELRCRIRTHVRNAAFADDGGDDHHVARALTPEDRERRPRRVVGAHVVHVNQPSHVGGRNLIDRAVDAEARVADHHVETAEVLDGSGDEPVHVGFVADVSGEHESLTAEAPHFVSDGLEHLFPPGAQRQRRSRAGRVQAPSRDRFRPRRP